MALREDEAVVRGLFGSAKSKRRYPSTRTAIRSAADIAEVGCPDFAAALIRTESTRNCWPSSRRRSASVMPRQSTVLHFPFAEEVTLEDVAGSRLDELSESGVSVWVDSLSREMLETGHLERLMAEDAVVGVTSNRRSSRRRSRRATGTTSSSARSSSAPTTRRRCSSRSPWRTSSAPAICSYRCGSAPTASTASSRSRSIQISPTSGRTRSSRRSSCTSSSIGRTCT